MTAVTYRNASCTYAGADRPAVDAFDLEIADEEFLVLVGPSGCGKSTSLRMAAGLEDVHSGSIHIGDRDVTECPPKDRDIAMVFQSYALYPHMTVAANMGFALTLRGLPKSVVSGKVAEAAKMLDLTELLDRKPKALSGGQRQRVAMGRAIVREPAAFLMDEPLSNLDAKLRVETRANIAALQRRLGTTTIYVTHDQVEAMTMGDRVAVLKDGRLQQCAAPRELYDRPANAFVATFIGSPAMNLLTAPLTPGGVEIDGYTVPLPRDLLAAASGQSTVTLGLRPESLQLVRPDEDGLDVTVKLTEELGADAYVHAASGSATTSRLVVRVDGRTPPSLGQVVRVALRDSSDVHLFHPDTGARLTGDGGTRA